MAFCRPCRHPERTSIDQKIVAGAALRAVSDYTVQHPPHLSLGSLHRHKAHIKEAIAGAIVARDGEGARQSSRLLTRLEEVIAAARALVGHASREGNFATANQALNTIIRCAELMARATGELQSPGVGIHFTSIHSKTVNINVQNNDIEIAMLVQEATNNFSPDEIARLRRLADSALPCTELSPTR